MDAKFCRKILELIRNGKIRNRQDLHLKKLSIAKELKMKGMPTNPDILSFSKNPSKKEIEILSIKESRTLSGIASIAIMTAPEKCPHGKCAMCPGGIDSAFGTVPQSYTGKEPATMRGIATQYDSYLQVFSRLSQYVATGHCPEKVELIIMGGTFPARKEKYRREFAGYALKAMNDFSEEFYPHGKLNFREFNEFFNSENQNDPGIANKIIKLRGKLNLKNEIKRNENSKIRDIATCIETRADYCGKKEINGMLALGTTRVELGVQSIYDSVLGKIERGHTVADSVHATQLMKDSALKVAYHIMPGLPGSDYEMDLEMFRALFEDGRFMPDALKIYPCMVMPGTKLYSQWKKGKFKPMGTEEAADLIAEAKRFVPEWCRIMRIQRDIPHTQIAAGVQSTNLRQIVQEIAHKKGIKCRCIRCREVGKANKDTEMLEKNENQKNKVSKKNSRLSYKIKKIGYEASKGNEIFIEANGKNNSLYGFARLRIPHKPFRKELRSKTALLRELHVYGSAVPIGEKGTVQHSGIGKTLMKEAERIAREEFEMKKLAVISGIGARGYYYKLGYKLDGAYVTKKF